MYAPKPTGNALKLTEQRGQKSGPRLSGVQDLRHSLQVEHGKLPAAED